MVHDFTIRVNVSHILQDFLRGYAFLLIGWGGFDKQGHFSDPYLDRFNLWKSKRPHPLYALTSKAVRVRPFSVHFAV